MATSTTTLMPIDTAVSPEQAARILPIRANLLPGELTAGRNARRTRFLLIAAVVLVVGVMAAWYVYARQTWNDADFNLTTANEQVSDLTRTKNKTYAEVTQLLNDRDRVKGELKSLLATDTSWTADFGYVSTDALTSGVTLLQLVGTLTKQDTGAKSDVVATIAVSGTGPDRRTIAAFIDKLAAREQLTQPYATTVTYSEGDKNYAFSLTVGLTSKALCGRYTTTCGTGD
ncbi:hypothetical protein AB0J83_11495 [Actinoplanes sp. NPDC049596]|uniref:PilN domain-containing protein n=1 Tax=unclassified Actinoplanes TaxID=2626549 RepID=UPI003420969A